MLEVPGLVDAGRGEEVGLVAHVLQVLLQVVVKSADVGSADAGGGGIVAGVLAGVVDVPAFEAGVVAAEGAVFVAEEFLAEAGGRDAELCLLEVLDAEAGEVGELLGDGVELGGRELVALRERLGVGAAGELAGLLDGLGHSAGVLALVVLDGDGGVGGKVAR